MSDETLSPAPLQANDLIVRADPELNPGAFAAVVPEAPSYGDHAKAARESAISALEALLADLTPVSSVDQVYPQCRADLAYAIHHLKQGRG